MIKFVLVTCLFSGVVFAQAKEENGFEAALRSTMLYNPQVHGQQSRVNAQNSAVEAAKTERYPTLRLSADNLDRDHDMATLTLNQPVWTFGKISSAIDLAEARHNAEQVALLQVRRRLLENTAAAYIRIEGIRQFLKIHQLNIEELEKFHQRITRRNQGKLASEADVRLAFSRLTQAKLNLERQKGELAIAESELLTYTKQYVGSEPPVAREYTRLPLTAEIQRQASQQHADILYSQALVKSARLALQQQRTAAFPTVSLQVEHELADVYNNDDRTRVGVVLSGSLDGMGFRSYNEVNSARSRLNAAQLDVDVARIEVSRRIKSLMLNRRTQESLREAQQATVDALESTRESYLRQYETNRKSWMELLNTQRELNTARIALMQIDNDWLSYSIQIVALTGGLDRIAGLQ